MHFTCIFPRHCIAWVDCYLRLHTAIQTPVNLMNRRRRGHYACWKGSSAMLMKGLYNFQLFYSSLFLSTHNTHTHTTPHTHTHTHTHTVTCTSGISAHQFYTSGKSLLQVQKGKFISEYLRVLVYKVPPMVATVPL